MIDLKEFYFQHIKESEYHYRFYNFIVNNNTYDSFKGNENTCDYKFLVFDVEEAITKFKELCFPPDNDFTDEQKCWFYLLTYFLHTNHYLIEEFPRILARPPVNPREFKYNNIRDYLFQLGKDEDGVIRYAARRVLVSSFNFKQKKEDSIEIKNDPFTNIKDYSMEETLGQGGFGIVYRYHNKCLDMDFAVKIYDPVFVSSDEQLEGEKRFFREARILFSLNSPHIARIYDAGRIDGKPFIRMEYINGYTLNKLNEKKGNLSFKKSAIVIENVLRGLICAHANGIIHRDLRPQNIVYSEEQKIFKIIDFGVSAFFDTDKYTKLTKTGERIAGGVYIDPILEQKPKLRDQRSDIYSVGAIWYFLLCGKAPSGSDMKDYLKQSNQQLSYDEIEIIMKCLSSDINLRYPSCNALYEIVYKIATQ